MDDIRVICGIDPGIKKGSPGAIVFYSDIGVGEPTWEMYPIPVIGKQLDIPTFKGYFLERHPQVRRVIIERSTFYTAPAILNGAPKKLSGYFGRIMRLQEHIGWIAGFCSALDISVRYVRPMDWKSKVLKGKDWKNNKSASLEYVQEAYPSIVLTGGKLQKIAKAEAVCLVEYAW